MKMPESGRARAGPQIQTDNGGRRQSVDFLETLSDDQTALLGCGVALLLCGGAMVISHTLRQWLTRTTERRQPPVEATQRPDGARAERKAA